MVSRRLPLSCRLFAAAAFFALPASQTQAAEAKEALEFITTAALIAKMKTPPEKREFTLIDARTRVEYEEGHIAGAGNVPANMVAFTLGAVANKQRLLIFYCNGPKCTKSQKAARAAMAMGYAKVIEYNEGLPAWIAAKQPVDGTPLPPVETKTISSTALEAEIKKGKAGCFLLDVRDRDEFDKSHIPGTVGIPVDDIEKRLAAIPQDRTLCLIDHSGHQTPLAARLLNKLGRTRLLRLDGGIVAWQQAERAVEASQPR